MEFVPAKREITIFDLMTHSSGLGQGPYGQTLCEKLQEVRETPLERARKYAKIALDFQPGEGSGYSPVIGMEVLAAIISVVSGEEIEEYLNRHVFRPLGITTMKWVLDREDKKNLVRLYEYTKDGRLLDVTDEDTLWRIVDASRIGYKSAAAGILGTVKDYEKIAHMLLNRGTLDGVQILKPETVEMMAGKGIPHTSVFMPGGYWGLSMAVFEDPEKCGCWTAPGSFGWSGAYGTHFYVDFQNHLDVVLGVNRSNIGGAGSYVSKAVEKAVTDSFLKISERDAGTGVIITRYLK